MIEAFQAYLGAQNLQVTRAEFERNLATKGLSRAFLTEVNPMLAPGVAYDAGEALELVRRTFIERLPGAPWKRR